MCILLLMRHGDNDYIQAGRLPGRMPGIHLNENGRTKVNRVAERLARIPIKAIYSSPLERAMETAKLIAEPKEMKVESREGLIEIDCGEWQGQRLSNLRRLKIWKNVQYSPSRFRFPGGETFYEGQQRICQEIESLSKQYESRDILVCVSHGDPIRLAIAHYVGMPIDMFQRLCIAPGSISALSISQAETRLIFINYDVTFSLAKA